MWKDEDQSVVKNVHSLTVSSEYIDGTKLLSPSVSHLKKNDLRRCHSWGSSLNRIVKRKSPCNKSSETKGIV